MLRPHFPVTSETVHHMLIYNRETSPSGLLVQELRKDRYTFTDQAILIDEIETQREILKPR